MKSKVKEVVNKLSQYVTKIENVIVRNWIRYTYFRILSFACMLPILAFAINTFPVFGSLVYVFLFIGGTIFLYFDSNRVKIANNEPEIFIKTEKIEKKFLNSFYVLYIPFFASLYLFLMSKQFNLNADFILNVLLLSASMFTGFLYSFTIMAIESSAILNIVKKRIDKKYHHRLTFFPSEKIRAKTRFSIISKLLNQQLNEKSINSKFSLVLDGLNIYNAYINRKFKFVIKDVKKFYNYMKLGVYLEKTKSLILLQINSLIEELEKEKDEPIIFIKILKTMLDQPTDNNSLFEEFEVEPRIIRKWVSKHISSLNLLLAITSIIVTILIAILSAQASSI